MYKINIFGINVPDVNLPNKLICYAFLNIFSTIFSSYAAISYYRNMYPEIINPVIILTPIFLGLSFIFYVKKNGFLTAIFIVSILTLWYITYTELSNSKYHTNPDYFFWGYGIVIMLNIALWFVISLIQEKIIMKYIN